MDAMMVFTLVILVAAPLWSLRRSIEAKLRGVSVQDLLQMKIERLERRIKSRQCRVVGTSEWVRGRLYSVVAVTLLYVLIVAGCYLSGFVAGSKHYVSAAIGLFFAWIFMAIDVGRAIRQRRVAGKVVRVQF